MSLPPLDTASLLDLLHEGVCVVNAEKRVTYCNDAAARMLGFRRDELYGRLCHEGSFMHLDGCGAALCHDRCPFSLAMGAARPREEELYLRHRDGHAVPVVVRIAPLRDAAGAMQGVIEIFTDRSLEKEMAESLIWLEQQAMLDALTGVPNRRFLELHLQSSLAELQRHGRPFGLLFIDVDRFKEVNDTLGHEVGDRVLVMVARTLQYSARLHDLVGRWGGDEYVALVSQVDAAHLLEVAQRFRSLVEQSSLTLQACEVRVTVSVGATLAQADDDEDRLLARADRALYAAKHGGRNGVQLG